MDSDSWKAKFERHQLLTKKPSIPSNPVWQCDWILGNGVRCEHEACFIAPWNEKKIFICKDHESLVSSVSPIKVEEMRENEFKCSHRVGILQCKHYAHYYTIGTTGHNFLWCRLHALKTTGEKPLLSNPLPRIWHPIIKKDKDEKKKKTTSFLKSEMEKIKNKKPTLL